MQTNDSNRESTGFRVDFIDPLFAVVIHIGFVEGLMTEPWFQEWRFPTGPEWLQALGFCVGLLTVILSWLGYHESIQSKPIKGAMRFVIDVLLLLVYIMMLVKYQSVGRILGLLAVVFFLFVLWDICKVREYKDQYAGNKKFLEKYPREAATGFFFLVSIIAWYLYRDNQHRSWAGVTFLITAVVINAGYRLAKKVL